MAKKCGLVIYNRPCRSKPRLFTKCDAARIAKRATETTNKEDVMVAVGYSLGYFVLADVSTLLDDVEYAKDLKKALDEYKSIRTPAEIAAVVAQGAIGLLRILVVRAIIFVLTKHTERLAIALAPAVLMSLRRHVIVGTPCLTIIGD